MTKAHHRRRQAAKAVRAREHSTHRESLARVVFHATKDTERVRLLCMALGWSEAEPIMATLEPTAEGVQP